MCKPILCLFTMGFREPFRKYAFYTIIYFIAFGSHSYEGIALHAPAKRVSRHRGIRGRLNVREFSRGIRSLLWPASKTPFSLFIVSIFNIIVKAPPSTWAIKTTNRRWFHSIRSNGNRIPREECAHAASLGPLPHHLHRTVIICCQHGDLPPPHI